MRLNDIKLTLPNHVYLLDVSVAHPLAKKFVKNTAKTRLAAASNREKVKLAKYGRAADLLNNTMFSPVVFETYGGIVKATSKFLQAIAIFARENSLTMSPELIMSSLRDPLAGCLQRGNAMMLRAGLSQAVAKFSRSCDQTFSHPPRRSSSSQSTPSRPKSAFSTPKGTKFGVRRSLAGKMA